LKDILVGTASSTQLGECALSHRDPGLFDSFVTRYGEIVELATRQSRPGADLRVFKNLRDLAREAGQRNASPQDLIAVHLSTLAILLKTKPQALARACVRHSRLLLVKMVGELALYYRDRSLAKAPLAGD
jgi:hypothetical protein